MTEGVVAIVGGYDSYIDAANITGESCLDDEGDIADHLFCNERVITPLSIIR